MLKEVQRFLFTTLLSSLCVLSLASLYTSHATRSSISVAIQENWQSFMLPFNLARLSIKEADERIFMPVENVSVSQIADTWGAPRSGGRRHQGQDIFAPNGTVIRSATDGFITRVADSGLGGKHIFVTGAGGRRYYYAHLEDWADVSFGDRVTASTIIGYVGNTGNAISTPPHLHFGVYTSSGAIDPLPLLKDR